LRSAWEEYGSLSGCWKGRWPRRRVVLGEPRHPPTSGDPLQGDGRSDPRRVIRLFEISELGALCASWTACGYSSQGFHIASRRKCLVSHFFFALLEYSDITLHALTLVQMTALFRSVSQTLVCGSEIWKVVFFFQKFCFIEVESLQHRSRRWKMPSHSPAARAGCFLLNHYLTFAVRFCFKMCQVARLRTQPFALLRRGYPLSLPDTAYISSYAVLLTSAYLYSFLSFYFDE